MARRDEDGFIIDPTNHNEMKYPTVDKDHRNNRIPSDSILKKQEVATPTGHELLDELSMRIAARDAGYNSDTNPDGYRAFASGWYARGVSGR